MPKCRSTLLLSCLDHHFLEFGFYRRCPFRSCHLPWQAYGCYYLGVLGILLVVAFVPIRQALSTGGKAPLDNRAPLNTEAPLSSETPSSNEANGPSLQSGVPPPPREATSGFLRTQGAKLVDAQGSEVRITGVNWFGMETGTFAPHGLLTYTTSPMARQRGEMATQRPIGGLPLRKPVMPFRR